MLGSVPVQGETITRVKVHADTWPGHSLSTKAPLLSFAHAPVLFIAEVCESLGMKI